MSIEDLLIDADTWLYNHVGSPTLIILVVGALSVAITALIGVVRLDAARSEIAYLRRSLNAFHTTLAPAGLTVGSITRRGVGESQPGAADQQREDG